ncbi:MAG: efflux RND transporter periplasmic adaptor subunit [bacterium]
MRTQLKLLVLALTSVMVLAACDSQRKREQEKGKRLGASPVTVQVASPESVPIIVELPGRILPHMVAELRPQVTGIVKQRLFTEGAVVSAGQILYQIEPAPYQAAYESAKAMLAKAEANFETAKLKAKRYKVLAKISAVSKQAYDDVSVAEKQAQADVAGAKAILDKAKIDLDFTRVTSPIAGRIGMSSVTVGALVTANQGAALAIVQQLDPIYVDVTQSSAEILRLHRRGIENSDVPVRLILEDDSIYELEGKLAFSEVSVDQATGSVTLRAVFPNPKEQLLPGMYVRAKITQGVHNNAFLIPHIAVSHDPHGNSLVMLVNSENKVEPKIVKTEQSIGDKWVVTEGLVSGDRVIIEGLQKARPGTLVKPEVR